jgi:hypothetical protein
MSVSFRFAALLAGLLCGAMNAVAASPGTPAGRLEATEARYPPWLPDGNNDAPDRGLVFTVPPFDVMADFHGSLDNPALVLYASGNYFFAMGAMVRAFAEAWPAYRGRVFYETLRPACC